MTILFKHSKERECREYEAALINGTGERETIDQGVDEMEGKDWRNQNNGTNGIYEIDGANTTDGGIDIHGADLPDEIMEAMKIIG